MADSSTENSINKCFKVVKSSSQEESFMCRICPYKFGNKNNAIRHMGKHRFPREVFPCSLCETIFIQKHSLEMHRVNHPSTQECLESIQNLIHVKKDSSDKELFVCRICSNGFSQRNGVIQHMFGHKLPRKVYPCNLCERIFLQNYNLEDHRMSHLGSHRTICKWLPCHPSQKDFKVFIQDVRDELYDKIMQYISENPMIKWFLSITIQFKHVVLGKKDIFHTSCFGTGIVTEPSDVKRHIGDALTFIDNSIQEFVSESKSVLHRIQCFKLCVCSTSALRN